jgi:signal peptidase II
MEFLYISLIIFLDQASKFLVKIKLRPIDNIDFINGYFSLTYVENRGAAFGIFRNKKILLVGITSIVIVAMIYYLVTNKRLNRWIKVSLILIIAGAIGNLIDRICLGYVVDFMHFYLKNNDFPVFNIADVSVVVGTILLALNLLFAKE